MLETPFYDDKLDYSKDEEDFEKIIDAIKVRNRRTEMNVPPSVKAKVSLKQRILSYLKLVQYFLKN